MITGKREEHLVLNPRENFGGPENLFLGRKRRMPHLRLTGRDVLIHVSAVPSENVRRIGQPIQVSVKQRGVVLPTPDVTIIQRRKLNRLELVRDRDKQLRKL